MFVARAVYSPTCTPSPDPFGTSTPTPEPNPTETPTAAPNPTPTAPGWVSVIDNETKQVVATIAVGVDPVSVAFTPDGTKAYVTNAGDNSISVIDTRTNAVVTTINLGVSMVFGTTPLGVAIRDTPEGVLAFVTIENTHVLAINTATDSCSEVGDYPACACDVQNDSCPGGPYPCCWVTGSDALYPAVGIALARSPAQPLGFVGTYDYATFAINTTTLSVVQSDIPTDYYPAGIALTPDDAYAYVVGPSFLPGDVSVIDTALVEVTPNPVLPTPVPVGSFPQGIAIGSTSNGVFAYVANSGDNNVSVIDTTQVLAGGSMAAFATVETGAEPSGVAMTPDGQFVYVTNRADGTVSVINTASHTIATPIAVGDAPRGIAVAIIGTPASTPTITPTPPPTPTP